MLNSILISKLPLNLFHMIKNVEFEKSLLRHLYPIR